MRGSFLGFLAFWQKDALTEKAGSFCGRKPRSKAATWAASRCNTLITARGDSSPAPTKNLEEDIFTIFKAEQRKAKHTRISSQLLFLIETHQHQKPERQGQYEDSRLIGEVGKAGQRRQDLGGHGTRRLSADGSPCTTSTNKQVFNDLIKNRHTDVGKSRAPFALLNKRIDNGQARAEKRVVVGQVDTTSDHAYFNVWVQEAKIWVEKANLYFTKN